MKKYLIIAVIAIIAIISVWYLLPAKQKVGYAYNDTKTIIMTATSTVDNIQNFDVKGKKDLSVAVIGTNATATVKFAGSISVTPGNPVGVVSSSNQWTYIQLTDLDLGTIVNGTTGLELTVGTTTKMYKLSGVNLNYLTPVITSYTTGTVRVLLISDEGSNR